MKSINYLFAFAFAILVACSGGENKEANNLQENSQNELSGAWQATTDTSTIVRIYQDQYFSVAQYNLEKKSFIGTYGGLWFMESGKYYEIYEFNSMDSLTVGDTIAVSFVNGSDKSLNIGNVGYANIDKNEPGVLEGAWLFAGRMKDNQVERREPSSRKTLKILSGTRFQWIAYNTKSKQFLGTGGGTYVSEGKMYVETIEFFSRDRDRVGAMLPFGFELIEGEWHHTGNSSAGNALYEIWAPRRKFEGETIL